MLFPAHAGMNRLIQGEGGVGNLFPAHAGMNRLTLLFSLVSSPVPRTRGDEP